MAWSGKIVKITASDTYTVSTPAQERNRSGVLWSCMVLSSIFLRSDTTALIPGTNRVAVTMSRNTRINRATPVNNGVSVEISTRIPVRNGERADPRLQDTLKELVARFKALP